MFRWTSTNLPVPNPRDWSLWNWWSSQSLCFFKVLRMIKTNILSFRRKGHQDTGISKACLLSQMSLYLRHSQLITWSNACKLKITCGEGKTFLSGTTNWKLQFWHIEWPQGSTTHSSRNFTKQIGQSLKAFFFSAPTQKNEYSHYLKHCFH